MPRILKAYPRTAYTFSSHFIRATFPMDEAALELEKEGGQPAKSSEKRLVVGLAERLVER